MRLLEKLMSLYYRCTIIKKKYIYFVGLGGQYSDNAKYISEKLHAKLPEVLIFWLISNKCKEKLPEYIIPVQENSLLATKLRFSSHVVVDCDMGVTIPYYMPFYRYTRWIIKRKGQLTISTWHGTPLKKILLDDMASNCRYSSKRHLLSDFIIAGCHFTANVLIKAIQGNNEYPIYLTGTPRNDIFFKQRRSNNIEDLKYKLYLPKDKRIILFAPTFRDTIKQSGIVQMEELNICHILEICSKHWNGEWIFVFRLHPRVLMSLDISSYESSYIVCGNKCDNMAEYLACSDILITDYSSTMFDFALTGRPCFLFAPDRDHYEKKERGFYLDYDSLPFPIAYTNDQLIEKIRTFDDVAYKRNVEQFLKDIGNVEDGRAAERIAECIVHFIKTGEKRLETVNGIERR